MWPGKTETSGLTATHAAAPTASQAALTGSNMSRVTSQRIQTIKQLSLHKLPRAVKILLSGSGSVTLGCIPSSQLLVFLRVWGVLILVFCFECQWRVLVSHYVVNVVLCKQCQKNCNCRGLYCNFKFKYFWYWHKSPISHLRTKWLVSAFMYSYQLRWS